MNPQAIIEDLYSCKNINKIYNKIDSIYNNSLSQSIKHQTANLKTINKISSIVDNIINLKKSANEKREIIFNNKSSDFAENIKKHIDAINLKSIIYCIQEIESIPAQYTDEYEQIIKKLLLGTSLEKLCAHSALNKNIVSSLATNPLRALSSLKTQLATHSTALNTYLGEIKKILESKSDSIFSTTAAVASSMIVGAVMSATNPTNFAGRYHAKKFTSKTVRGYVFKKFKSAKLKNHAIIVSESFYNTCDNIITTINSIKDKYLYINELVYGGMILKLSEQLYRENIKITSIHINDGVIETEIFQEKTGELIHYFKLLNEEIQVTLNQGRTEEAYDLSLHGMNILELLEDSIHKSNNEINTLITKLKKNFAITTILTTQIKTDSIDSKQILPKLLRLFSKTSHENGIITDQHIVSAIYLLRDQNKEFLKNIILEYTNTCKNDKNKQLINYIIKKYKNFCSENLNQNFIRKLIIKIFNYRRQKIISKLIINHKLDCKFSDYLLTC